MIMPSLPLSLFHSFVTEFTLTKHVASNVLYDSSAALSSLDHPIEEDIIWRWYHMQSNSEAPGDVSLFVLSISFWGHHTLCHPFSHHCWNWFVTEKFCYSNLKKMLRKSFLVRMLFCQFCSFKVPPLDRLCGHHSYFDGGLAKPWRLRTAPVSESNVPSIRGRNATDPSKELDLNPILLSLFSHLSLLKLSLG